LAYHEARKRAAVAGGVPAKEVAATDVFLEPELAAVDVSSEIAAD